MLQYRVFTPARCFGFIVAFVITSFVTAHVLTVREMRRLEQEAQELEATTRHLQLVSTLRDQLHGMGMAAGAATLNAVAGRPSERSGYDRSRQRVAEALASYRALLSTTPETAQLERLTLAVERTRTVLEQTWELLQQGRVREAAAVDSMSPQREAQSILLAMQALHARELSSIRYDIRETGNRVRRVAPLHDAVAALFSLVLLLLGLHLGRQYLRLSEERRRTALERSQELELFAARVAHDIKNPIGAMTLRLALAVRRNPDPRVASLVAALEGNVRRVTAIIDGLLDFARTGGRPQLGESADLGPVLEGVLEDFLPEAEQRGIELGLDPGPAVAVACPAGPLYSIVGNLVRNAVKYIDGGPGGERRIRVRALERQGLARVEVEDTGAGIPDGLEKSVFEPFVRGTAVGSRPGIGLGLATVKRLVEAHGGTVGVTTRTGHGSLFWFELPAAPPGGPVAAPPAKVALLHRPAPAT